MHGDGDIEIDEGEERSETDERVSETSTTRFTSSMPLRIENILSAFLEMQPQEATSPAGGLGRSVSFRRITLRDLSRVLLGSTRLRADTNEDDDIQEENDEDEDEYFSARRAHQWFPEAVEPQKAGVELLMSGEFGRVGPKIRFRQGGMNIAKTIKSRSARRPQTSCKEDYTCNLVPNSNGTAVAVYDANIYTGQFSADSSFYYTCSQDFFLHIFDTTAPVSNGSSWRIEYLPSNLQTTMNVRNTIHGHPGRWTITDANLSPDNERMIYSSITPTVYMTSTLDSSPTQIPIPFADPASRSQRVSSYSESFGIYSCRFSADGNEVIAGGSGNLFVYDLLANRRTVKIVAHADDVNSCCWADTASGNVLVSASDDTFIKVWDRRSLGTSHKPSGVLVGHTEGITYVSAKGDGRYIISNGKDQAMRLWDLRKMQSNADFERIAHKDYGVRGFDYRYSNYSRPKYHAHPQDCSVMTYRGHSVLRTLIRCHFSPLETTGGQYLYSGSSDGRIHIWSLDGRVVEVLDRTKTLPITFDPSGPEIESRSGMHSVCVRDVSWHSQEPVIFSAGWEGSHGGSIVARHEWKGLSKMSGALEDWVEKNRHEQGETSRRRSVRLQERADRRANQLTSSTFRSGDEEE